jgi:methionyl-tRNA formyltransferase
MRIIFMGTPDFAVPSLQILVENGYKVVAVVTSVDKPAGRGLQVHTSAVKNYAVAHHIPVLQPSNLKSVEFLEELKSYQADLQIVVAFRMLPESIWAMPKLGTFNLHASLLPKYRGAAPINWAIINGEQETGLTTFFLQHEIDTGDIILQEKEPIHDTDTVGLLYERLMQKGATLVLTTVKQIEIGTYTLSKQAGLGEIKHAPKIFKETCQINFQQNTKQVYNFVRGLSPYPSAWTILQGKVFKIYQAKGIIEKHNEKEGHIATDQKTYLHFATQDGWLAAEEVQLEGKKRMNIVDFLRGFRF